MRLGGPIYAKYETPEKWCGEIKKAGYSAAFCPVKADAAHDEIKAYREAARKNGIIIAEVGAWSNPLSPDEKIRKEAMALCKQRLHAADLIGASCCVNIAGSRGTKWDGPSALDLTPETFEMIVDVVREIIDDVKPANTFYTLEPMPWMYPDSPESYLELIKAVDRNHFAVHLDPVNIINCPERYFHNGKFLKHCFELLEPHIKSCHAKDIILRDNLTVHLDEVRPGLGSLDYQVYLRELSKLDPDLPLMIEHLPNEEEYQKATEYIKSVKCFPLGGSA